MDVACGTGLSSLALSTLAERVIATDISEEMLSQAPKAKRVSYHLAPAESLPLDDSSTELITVSSAFHWFNRKAFLREARRVLCVGGWLVIYENFFEGRRHPNADVVRWLGAYYRAHPAPFRDRAPFADEDAQKAGFDFLERLTYENNWAFQKDEFVAYLLSQSNAVAALKRGPHRPEEMALALSGQLEPFFRGREETFAFAGFIWLLRKL